MSENAAEGDKIIEAILSWYERKPNKFKLSQNSIIIKKGYGTSISLVSNRKIEVVKKTPWYKPNEVKEVITEFITARLNIDGQNFFININDDEKVQKIKLHIEDLYKKHRQDILDKLTKGETEV